MNTFSGAAETLFCAQPAIAQQMQRLELQMGCCLFQKKARGLTPRGQQLAEYARRKLAINDVAVRNIDRKQLEGEI